MLQSFSLVTWIIFNSFSILLHTCASKLIGISMSDEIYIAVYWSRIIVWIVEGSACKVRLLVTYPVIPAVFVYMMCCTWFVRRKFNWNCATNGTILCKALIIVRPSLHDAAILVTCIQYVRIEFFYSSITTLNKLDEYKNPKRWRI